MLTPAHLATEVHHFNNQIFSFEKPGQKPFKNMKGAKDYAAEDVSLIRSGTRC